MHVHHSRSRLIRAQDDAVKLGHPVLGVGHRVNRHGAKEPACCRSSIDCGAACLSKVKLSMASRIVRRSVFSTASLECCTTLSYRIAAIPMRMAMIVMTIISSMRVNPKLRHAPRLFRGQRSGIWWYKCVFTFGCSSHHQSEYFVPSIAVAVDWEYTSKTSLPPHCVDSGSSCTARRPQSGWPVIGSIGIFRRK